jgi:hypothetical protein
MAERPKGPTPDGKLYTVQPARYAKGQILVQTVPNGTGLKIREDRLLCALNCRYTHRERGYVCSPSKVRKFEHYLAEGWDATIFGELRPPQAP